MLYTESRERSAEILRSVLTHMGRHDAIFSPITYAVWYEYAAGINSGLNQALDRTLQSQPRLDDNTMRSLYQDHIVRSSDVTTKRLSNEFARLMANMATSAAQTGDQAQSYGAQLESLLQALRANDGNRLPDELTQALSGTSEMKGSAASLQQQVQLNQHEIQRLQSELERAREDAMVDGLTSILNRRGFDHRLRSLLQASAGSDGPHCMIMLDIDHFKKVNDTYGHIIGDRVIQGIGEILRNSSFAGAQAVARYGGEEFAVLLPQTPLEKAAQAAQAVSARVKAMRIRNRNTQETVLSVTVSAGVTVHHSDDDATSFIARADAALYKSKQAGRDRVTCA